MKNHEIKKAMYCLIISLSILLLTNSFAQEVSSAQLLKSDTSVKADMDALTGKDARNAFKRLVEKGDEVVDQVEAALSSNQTSAAQKKALVYVLAAIGNEKSIAPILLAAKNSSNDNRFSFAVISALSRFKQNDKITDYIDELLGNKNIDPNLLRQALAYCYRHPYDGAKKWAKLYSEPGNNDHIRAEATYLGAVLGMTSFKEDVIKALNSNASGIDQSEYVLSLALLSEPGEFNSLVKGMKLKKIDLDTARLNYYLKKGNAKERKTAAKKIVDSHNGFLIRDAVHCLIQENDAESLALAWLRHNRIVVSALRDAGLTIVFDKNGPKFSKRTNEGSVILYSKADKIKLEEAFVRSIFDTLKNSDKEKFINTAVLNASDMAMYDFINKAIVHNNKGEDSIESQGRLSKLHESVLLSWDQVYAAGKKNNLIWSDARYVASDVTKYTNPDISFLIGYKGHYYKVALFVAQLPQGMKWKLQGSMKWVGNKLSPGEWLAWSHRAEKNNDVVSARQLKILGGGNN